jgi:hypothetical protein
MRGERRQRMAIAFGLEGHGWNEELVLQRYELLYEAALVGEAHRDLDNDVRLVPGPSMAADHRRILATGIARLRSKIKYRPVVFELMPPVFTLLQLQRAVEALAGRLVHKPNFRRLIEQQELVEEAGETTSDTVGRPSGRVPVPAISSRSKSRSTRWRSGTKPWRLLRTPSCSTTWRSMNCARRSKW